MTKHPTIKGLFVRSHITALRNALGEDAVLELERRYGAPLSSIKNLDDVPIEDEIAIIEHALDILNNGNINHKERAFEAGRLHVTNFMTTPIGKFLSATIHDPRKVFSNAGVIAEQVFNGISYESTELDSDRMRIVMKGGVYPLDHFRGFFCEWLNRLGYECDVTARKPKSETYEYEVHFKKRPRSQ